MGLFDRLRRRPRLVDQLAAPALVCADDGQVLEANAAAEALLAAHGLATGTLPAEAWPPLDGAPVAEILMVQAGLLFSRHRLADARWLVLPRPADDPAQTARLFRSAHELLARVIATIAHDLRSPLASLFFNVGVLRRRFADLERAEVEATLDAMSRACELEMKIIGALVERIDADGREGTPLGRLFERIVDLLSPHFRDGTNRLVVEVDEALVVPGASLLLDQIFVNLIGNAVESRPGAVTVRITSERAPGERLVRIRVANDGPPVEGAQRALIFRPFYTTKPTGTGTGLSFAQEAARQLGGDLVLLPNALTTFEVALPVRDDGGDGGDGPPKTHIG
ncbi:MAG: HAMP domain-containing histidine kinase [Myxococcales bacterium]|nr:HAMP domain-containing histidine kinase [Myxococcales bacterium]MCB9549242.1 HAMP domain-containing histidine kinase [Myxococcales bacterium]